MNAVASEPNAVIPFIRPARLIGTILVDAGRLRPEDIEPVLALGGWGVHMPYHVTWVHETDVGTLDPARMRRVDAPAELPAAVRALAR